MNENTPIRYNNIDDIRNPTYNSTEKILDSAKEASITPDGLIKNVMY